jgi:hypothetical protein
MSLVKVGTALFILFAGVQTLSANAAERRIDITGTFSKDIFQPDMFGTNVDTLPFSASIVLEDADPAIVTLPAGIVVNNQGGTLARETTVVPLSALRSVDIAIGTAIWSLADVLTRTNTTLGVTYALLVEGGIAAPSNSLVYFNVFNSNLGSVDGSNLGCISNVCSLENQGQSYDVLSGGFAILTGLSATISSVAQTPLEQIADLQEEVEALGISSALLEAVEAKWDVKSGRNDSARSQLDAFVKQVEAQVGKKLTRSQADALISRAREIQAAL